MLSPAQGMPAGGGAPETGQRAADGMASPEPVANDGLCANCGQAGDPATPFCPHCGARRTAPLAQPAASEPPAAPVPPAAPAPAGSPAAAPRGRTALWAGGVVLLVGALGAAVYWGRGDPAADDAAARRLAVEEKRRQAAEKAAEAAELRAAKALFERHIALEEAQAQARAATPPGRRAPLTPAVEKSARK